MQWNFSQNRIPTTIEELKEILLQNRNIDSNTDTYFSPKEPMRLTAKEVAIDVEQLEKAVKRIQKAIKQKQKIVVFGDYDVDGICATAVLWQTLFSLKAKAMPFIPHRQEDGYGLKVSTAKKLIAEQQPDLIITVDNGIVAHEVGEFLKTEGIDLIITDHHQSEKKEEKEIFPSAEAVVHTTQLCGTTVAWMVAKELIGSKAKMHLDLCCLATIADQVPLLEANRSFAYYGLEALKLSNRRGIQALCEQAKVDQRSITEWTVGFTLAPRINAMGRLDHGMDALRLLCTNNTANAQQLARKLDETNTQRQDLTKELLDIAKEQAGEQTEEHVIIVASPEFHEGVLGLLAGKLVEIYKRPAIAIAVSDELAKGSARSLNDISVVELLRKVKDDLLEVGGHTMAAGFSLDPDTFDEVQKKLWMQAKGDIPAEKLIPELLLDCGLSMELVRQDIIEELEQFAPFGMGNIEPVFALNAEVLDAKLLGREQQHLKLFLAHTKDSQPVEALLWYGARQYEQLSQMNRLKVAGTLQLNRWKNRVTPQIMIKDIQPAEFE